MTDGQEAALGRGAEVRGSPHTARRTTGGRRARARESRAVARSFKTILSCVSFLLRGRVSPSQVHLSAANRLIGEVVQSRRRPLLGPSLG